jgi:hypothetical protein
VSKFDEFFAEVQFFSNGVYVLSYSYSKDEASKMFSEYMGKDFSPEYLGVESVRYGFAPEYVEDMAGVSCWYMGGKEGKGSKAVWVTNKQPKGE